MKNTQYSHAVATHRACIPFQSNELNSILSASDVLAKRVHFAPPRTSYI